MKRKNSPSNGVMENSAARLTPAASCAPVKTWLWEPQVTLAFAASRFFTRNMRRLSLSLKSQKGMMPRVPSGDFASPSKQKGYFVLSISATPLLPVVL